MAAAMRATSPSIRRKPGWPIRSAGASTVSTRGIEQRLDRAIAVLERVVAAIDAGNDEAVPALKTLVRQAGRSAAPLGRRL